MKHVIFPAHFVLKDNKGIGKMVGYGHKVQNLCLKHSIDIYSDERNSSAVIGKPGRKILVENLMYIATHSLN